MYLDGKFHRGKQTHLTGKSSIFTRTLALLNIQCSGLSSVRGNSCIHDNVLQVGCPHAATKGGSDQDGFHG